MFGLMALTRASEGVESSARPYRDPVATYVTGRKGLSALTTSVDAGAGAADAGEAVIAVPAAAIVSAATRAAVRRERPRSRFMLRRRADALPWGNAVRDMRDAPLCSV
ncbi:hypothetical protein GCM10023194_57610 [Planotetraspora phitsanulokensis]|uniref:Uncharacterized protein n=1 Tax=Planotetraspora phitsanulokensis TaxID=575192 RepID=A0A8J3UIM2_9ACTN|nr:hypothetical protein Pph01_79920 [Planotetraspora phitsanulokensis]